MKNAGMSDKGRSNTFIRALPLLLICLAAAGLRIWLLREPRVVWGDEPFYLWLGRNWITGQGFSFTGHADVHHAPLFPMLSGLLYLVTGDMARASEVLYVLFGALLVLPMYAIGTEVYDRRTGYVAAVLTAVFPPLTAGILHWGTMTEALYMFFVYSGLWAGLRTLRPLWRKAVPAQPGEAPAEDAFAAQRQDPWWAYALAGLCFGLAYLTRPEGIGYAVVVGAFIVLLRAVRRRLWEKALWLKLLLMVAAFALAFVPYAYYVYLQTGAFMVSEKVGVTYLTCLGLVHGDTAAFDRATWGLDSTGLETFFFSPESYDVSMLQLVLADLRSFALIIVTNALDFVKTLIGWTMLPYLLLPAVFLGLFRRGWTRERTWKELYLVASFLPTMAFMFFFIQERYIVAMLPVFILWIAAGLLELSDWLMGTWVLLRSPAEGPYWHMPAGLRVACEALPVLLIVAGLLALHPRVVAEVTNVGSVRMEHRWVGEALHDRLTRDTVLMSRYPAIAFYADTRWVPTPNASWPEILTYARHKGVHYMAIDERELRYRPQLANLVTGEQVPAELERVYQSTVDGERMTVYRLVE